MACRACRTKENQIKLLNNEQRMNRMKKLWAVLLLLVASGQVFADEGMWVLKELNKQNLERMKELGFTPSYEQLYSETDPCVANAW